MRNGKQSPKIIVIMGVILLGLVAYALMNGMTLTKIAFLGANVELQEKHKADVVTIRVNVLGTDNVPVEDAKVWLSLGGEAKKVAGGWEFDLPFNRLTADHKLDVYAEQQATHLKGHREVVASDSRTLTITIPLMRDTSAYVKGTVSDANSRPVAGATVNIVGAVGSVTTDAQGFFSLPANAAEGEEVRLRVLRSGYEPIEQDHPAGVDAAYIILRRIR